MADIVSTRILRLQGVTPRYTATSPADVTSLVPLEGMTRYNPVTKRFEYYDGTDWLVLGMGSEPYINLSHADFTGTLDFTNFSGLIKLNTDYNRQDALLVAGCTGMEELYCRYDPNLTELDVHTCDSLVSLDSTGSPIATFIF